MLASQTCVINVELMKARHVTKDVHALDVRWFVSIPDTVVGRDTRDEVGMVIDAGSNGNELGVESIQATDDVQIADAGALF